MLYNTLVVYTTMVIFGRIMKPISQWNLSYHEHRNYLIIYVNITLMYSIV